MKSRFSVFSLFILLVLLSFAPGSIHSDDFTNSYLDLVAGGHDENAGLTMFPILSIPAGGVSEGLGSAYTALPLSPAFPEAHPAGSSLIDGAVIALSHREWIADAGIESVKYVHRLPVLGGLGIGVQGKFLHMPFTGYDEFGEKTGSGYITENVIILNAGYAFLQDNDSGWFDRLSIGLNSKFVFRTVPADVYAEQNAFSAAFDLGVHAGFAFGPLYGDDRSNFRFGAVMRNFGPFALGYPLPSEISLGISYRPLKFLAAAVDVNIPVSFDGETFPQEKVHGAVGLNFFLLNFLSLQTGVHLRGDNPRYALGALLSFRNVSYTVNYNLDIINGANPLGTFSLEIAITVPVRKGSDAE